ncbi:MAG: LysE family translocator [Antarcticimicrobium sp.]|uniref:LysE family translocator n=1 Tax=Antarcticimicrobium sp. TaxID=2824147 RepID=UPI002617567C|nr:LysE family translocator [Antarcticimicrobium sp.]MDF1717676.1 LysE family translocator [Antarcticimicrobium sp.]
MSDHLASLALALGIFSLGFISIGPNILAIIGTSMERGRAQGKRLAMGVAVGSGLWATLTVGGLTALITAYAEAVTVLKVFGAGYLLWLAYKAFRSAARPEGDIAARAARGGNLFLRGLTVQMTNPKAALQWIAIVGIGLGPEAPLWTGLALIAIATSLSLAGHLAYAVTFSTQPVIVFYRRARRWIDAGLGLFFTFAAFKLATFER